MAEKKFNARIVHKHDTEENWNKATNFIPKKSELIVYDKDATYDYERLKIGDGVTDVKILPFVTDNLEIITVDEINAICATTIQIATSSEVTF